MGKVAHPIKLKSFGDINTYISVTNMYGLQKFSLIDSPKRQIIYQLLIRRTGFQPVEGWMIYTFLEIVKSKLISVATTT